MVRTLGMRPQLCAVFGGETGQVARYLAELEDLDVRHDPLRGVERRIRARPAWR